ncbi:hypothetical protein [Nocardia sp. NPDC055049]
MITVVWLLVWICVAMIALPHIAKFFTRDSEALSVMAEFAFLALIVLVAILLGVAATGTAPIA